MEKDLKNILKDWADEHKKQQDGYITMTPDGGDVEANVARFNAMSTPNCDACCEELDDLMESKQSETISIEYPKLAIEVCTYHGNPTGYYDVSFGNWLPDDDEFETRYVEWTYEVDKDELYTYVYENALGECPYYDDEMFDPNAEKDWSKFVKWLDDNFDAVYENNKQDIMSAFEDDASEEAREYYNDDASWYEESLEHQNNQLRAQEVELDDIDDDYSATFIEGCSGIRKLKVLRGECDEEQVDYDDNF